MGYILLSSACFLLADGHGRRSDNNRITSDQFRMIGYFNETISCCLFKILGSSATVQLDLLPPVQ